MFGLMLKPVQSTTPSTSNAVQLLKEKPKNQIREFNLAERVKRQW